MSENNAFNIINNHTVALFFKNTLFNEVMGVVSLLADNRDNFLKLYGKPSYEENGTSYWRVNYQSIPYLLACDPERNSTIYYVYYKEAQPFEHNSLFGSDIIGYLKWILEQKTAKKLH